MIKVSAENVASLLRVNGVSRDDIADAEGHTDSFVVAYIQGPCLTPGLDGKWVLILSEGTGEYTEEMWFETLRLLEEESPE
jgi:hypothetical protein